MAGHTVFEPMERITRNHFNGRLQFQEANIIIDHSGRWEMLFDEGCSDGAPTDGFASHGARTGEPIDRVCTFDSGSDQIEHCLTHSVFHGASALVTAVLNLASTIFTSDDPQSGLQGGFFGLAGAAGLLTATIHVFQPSDRLRELVVTQFMIHYVGYSSRAGRMGNSSVCSYNNKCSESFLSVRCARLKE